jgi:ABC-2 type transport system permease protein
MSELANESSMQGELASESSKQRELANESSTQSELANESSKQRELASESLARNGFRGTGAMIRLALRRDRILLPVWILVFVAFAYSSAASTAGLYPTVESRVALATTANANPSLLALYGWVFEPTSLGAVGLYKLIALGAAMVAVLTFLITIRHSRTEEEAGRLELVGAGVVGRYAPLTAALSVSAGTALVLGLLSGLTMTGTDLPASGSFAFGLGWAATGIVFAAVAAVAAQLTTGARAANGIAGAALGVAYLIRAIGDATGTDGPTWLSWLSPLGWSAQVRPFAGDRWWVLVLPLAFAALLTVGAYALVSRRDVGAGILPDRLGPARAPASLGSPFGLALRLQRGSLIGWTLAGMIGGLAFGGIAANVGDLVDSDQARELITKLGGTAAVTDAFIATEMSFVGIAAAAFGIAAAMRLRSEETSLRAEPVLATAVGRTRWAASHLAIAFGGPAVVLLGAGVAAGLSYGAATDMGQFGRVVGAAAAQVPATWVLVGILVLAYGFLPRLNLAGWAALVIAMVIGTLGPLLNLSQSVMDVSPFTHIPKLPAAQFTATPLLWLTAVAVVALAAGLAGFRRRDLSSG